MLELLYTQPTRLCTYLEVSFNLVGVYCITLYYISKGFSLIPNSVRITCIVAKPKHAARCICAIRVQIRLEQMFKLHPLAYELCVP